MAWLSAWQALLECGFSEAVVASCMFGSIHRKEFRLLCYLLDTVGLDVRCCGGHTHVRIQGAYTKPSATYTDGVALHIASAFRKALRKRIADDCLVPPVEGHETVLSNDIMLGSKRSVVRSWFWKRKGHINVLETSSAVSNLVGLATHRSSVRFCHFLDSSVAKGALSKGRSTAKALQPLLKRAGCVCVAADLYPGWAYSPTRLNVADDPTRDCPLRLGLSHSLISAGVPLSLLRDAGLRGLRKFAANWVRLVLLALCTCQAQGLELGSDLSGDAPGFGFSEPCKLASGLSAFGHLTGLLSRAFSVGTFWRAFGLLAGALDLPSRCFGLTHQWCFPGLASFGQVSGQLSYGLGLDLDWLCPVLVVVGLVWCLGGLRSVRGKSYVFRGSGGVLNQSLLPFLAAAMVLSLTGVQGMPLRPCSKADRERMMQRLGNLPVPTRAVKEQTRQKRKIYLDRFRAWLWSEKGISFRYLIEAKPPDPEKISQMLIDYGRDLYAAGRAYGIYSETINAVAVERPLIRRQLNGAWDYAFAWLADEPHQHHPAMPLAVLAAMVTVALTWGWPHEAAVLLIGWAGLMRIGEVLSATRGDLVLPCDSIPGTTFALVIIRQPKTRGRSAKHQAARIDQSDIISFLTAVYEKADRQELLWPFSASTLRKRFGQLLAALELPVKRDGVLSCFDLGSLRPGGATWLLHRTEQPELVRRRGRWLSIRTMEIYLQEVLVVTFEEKVSPRTRFLIQLCASGFAKTLERVQPFLNFGIPPRTWYFLLVIIEDIQELFQIEDAFWGCGQTRFK